MGEVIKFESAAEKTGFHELEELFLNLDNHYRQALATTDRDSLQTDTDKSKASAQIAGRISELLDDLDGARTNMPSVGKFTVLVNKFLELPFGEHVPNNVGYLGLPAMAQALAEKYRRTLEAIQAERFNDTLN